MYCKKCGKPNPDDSNFCRNCGAPLKRLDNSPNNIVLPPTPQAFSSQPIQQQPTKHKGKGRLIAIIAVVAFFVIVTVGFNLLSGSDNQTAPNTSSAQVKSSTKVHSTTAETTTEAPTLSAKEFKAACKTIPYKDIARQPEKYYDENLVYTGKIFQVSQKQDDGMYYALVNVTKDEYDFYDDAMYIGFELEDGEPRFLEDDIITFYGVGRGDMSYESILGNEITVPAVLALYIELEK